MCHIYLLMFPLSIQNYIEMLHFFSKTIENKSIGGRRRWNKNVL